MIIAPEGNHNVGIMAQQTVFPTGATVRKLHITVCGRRYQVYLDVIHHKECCKDATYVLLCILKGPKVANICCEDEMAYLMEVWMKFVLSSSHCLKLILILLCYTGFSVIFQAKILMHFLKHLSADVIFIDLLLKRIIYLCFLSHSC